MASHFKMVGANLFASGFRFENPKMYICYVHVTADQSMFPDLKSCQVPYGMSCLKTRPGGVPRAKSNTAFQHAHSGVPQRY